MDEQNNLTIRLLHEMRGELRQRFPAMEQLIKDRFAIVEQSIKLQEQNVDGNTLILNMLAGTVRDHERRIEAIEARWR